MTIAITGATGKLGRLVIRQMKEQAPAAEIVALVRSTAKASDLGMTAREADYSKPQTLDSALTGVDTLLLISSNEVGRRATQHRNVIEAARKAGVRRIIYTSLLHADTSPMSIAGEHLQTEAAILGSGIPYTILRNGWYTENYTASIPGALVGGPCSEAQAGAGSRPLREPTMQPQPPPFSPAKTTVAPMNSRAMRPGR